MSLRSWGWAGKSGQRDEPADVIRIATSIVLPPLGLFLVYAIAPLDPARNGLAVASLLVGLIAFVCVLAFQLKKVAHSERPVLAAVSAIALIVPLLLIVFAYSYAVVSAERPGSFNEPLSKVDAFYFTITTFATVGFGDIYATSEALRGVVAFQIAVDLIVIGGLLRLFATIAKRQAGRTGALVRLQALGDSVGVEPIAPPPPEPGPADDR